MWGGVRVSAFSLVAGRRMRIQYCSDLHLGIQPTPLDFTRLVVPTAPVLALLGDVGTPDSAEFRRFIHWCCTQWARVLFVPGNHEFWRLTAETQHLTPDEILGSLRAFETQYPNFTLCWRTTFIGDDGNILLATPLWRPVPDDTDRSDPARVFDAATVTRLYNEDIRWLQTELRHHIHKQVIVLTHYEPFFATTHNLLTKPINAWICGHTHSTLHWMKPWETTTGESGTILLVSNSYGYSPSNPQFQTDAVLSLPAPEPTRIIS